LDAVTFSKDASTRTWSNLGFLCVSLWIFFATFAVKSLASGAETNVLNRKGRNEIRQEQ
jgi:hypothetical protein